ncbi:MAG: pentapeptide repeat-containing protein [Pseudomonadota bacterium]
MNYRDRQPQPIEIADDPVDQHLAHIAEVSRNARGAWFGLLAALVYVTVTLLGHEDADFFAFGAATTLPIFNIDVPPEAFFTAAPILVSALYIYLHLYLQNLWEALADAEPRAKGAPLSQKVFPTLMSAAALWYRQRARQDGSEHGRAMGGLTFAINLLLIWVFGWGVLAGLWIRSMPAHIEWITLLCGACFGLAFCISLIGARAARRLLKGQPVRHWKWPWINLPASLATLALTGWLSWETTEGGFMLEGDPLLMPAYLVEKELTVKPADWVDFETWIEDFEIQWRRDHGVALSKHKLADLDEDLHQRMMKDAWIRWGYRTEALQNRSLQGYDLRRANMHGAFLAGADLRSARIEGADLGFARLEGADLKRAGMEGASLFEARLEGADLRNARMEGAGLGFARMAGANLIGADLKFTNLRDWSIARASLRSVDFTGAEHFTQEALNSAFGDEETVLPEGLNRPCHWSGVASLGLGNPAEWDVRKDTAYQAWIADLDAGRDPCAEDEN